MDSKNAINFLMWSYFNLTLEDGNEVGRILAVCIQRAYSDATQQGAYNALIAKENRALKEASKEAEKKGGKILVEAISLLLPCNKQDFDAWHKETCTALKKVYKDAGNRTTGPLPFSYGNVQKWVNMTLKYLYLLYELYQSYSPNCLFCVKYKNVMKKYAKKFHIPIDSLIIEALWDTDIALPITGEKQGAYSSEKVAAWSKWEDKSYDNFQKTLQKNAKKVLGNQSQLEWEGSAWIKAAKKRKEKELQALEKQYNGE